MIDIVFGEKAPYEYHFNDKNLLDINEYKNSIVLDFFDLISYICYTDFFTERDEDVNNLRKLTLTVPVENIEIFQGITEKLEELLTYMTNGEKWKINFIKSNIKKELYRQQTSVDNSKEYNSISLLSGGLDAMAGSVIERENNTIFVTYGSNLIEVSNANNIYENLIKSSNNNHVVVEKINMETKQHYTERTRSLIFVASSLIYADNYNVEEIKLYENGIMSLNPKFNFSRRVTKTTNQKTLFYLNEILKDIGIDIKIINPFKYKTKKEITDIIPESYSEFIIKGTRTCSKNSGIVHFRNKDKGNFHCGMCIACILRQIGVLSSSKEDAEYLLPIDLYCLKDIVEYEIKISKNRNQVDDSNAAIYKFNEKRSLIEYYRSYYMNIKNGTIYNYLDLKREYYEDETWIEEINSMLNKFGEELEVYFSKVGIEI